MELFTSLLAGFFLWVFLLHWHHSALARAREVAGPLLIEVDAGGNAPRLTGRQQIDLAVGILVLLLFYVVESGSRSFALDLAPGVFLFSLLSALVPLHRRDAPIEIRQHGVVRRRQSYEKRPGRLVFTPWGEMAGGKWHNFLPDYYIHTRLGLMERTVPAEDIKAVTAVVGRFVPVYDADGNLVAKPETAGEAASPAARTYSHRLNYQFNLQSLMILTVVVACVASCYGMRYRRLQPQRKAVAQLQSLGARVLELGDGVHDVDFSNSKNRPTDADLAQLEPLVSLRWLNLSGSPVTDAGLTHLKGLKNLQRIDLTGTRVTSQGVAELRRALPHTRVEFAAPPPTVPPPPPSGGKQ